MNFFPALLALSILVQGWTTASAPHSDQGTSTLSGSWTATVGESQTLRGRWIGEAIPKDPSSAHGSWTMAGSSGKAALTGTWAAHKTPKGWQGAWSAKTSAGRTAAGTWQADLPASSKATLKDFLELLLNQAISGTWRSGRLYGAWRLECRPKPSGR